MSLLLVCIAPCLTRAQSAAETAANDRPAILGSLDNGKYSNPVIGFEMQLDPLCALSNEASAIEFAHRAPQRLILSIRCDDYTLALVSWPIHADESSDLITQSEPSILGAMHGLRNARGLEFKRRGGWQKVTASGTQILVQELAARAHSGEAVVGFYNGFEIGRRYISILVVGPGKKRPQLSQLGTTFRLTGR